MMDNNVAAFQTIEGQPPSCENCANYHTNAERAYHAMEAFARTKQQATTLQEKVKDLSSVLQDRQEFILDLQKKLEVERARNIQVEQQLKDKQIELDCTKEQLEFVRAEADKNKTYQKQYGVLNSAQMSNDQPSTSSQETIEHQGLTTRRRRSPRKAAKKGSKNVQSLPISSSAVSKDILMAELDSDDASDELPTDATISKDMLMAEMDSDDAMDELPTDAAISKDVLMAEVDSDEEELPTSSAISKDLLMAEVDSEEESEDPDDLSNFQLARPKTRSARKNVSKSNSSSKQPKSRSKAIRHTGSTQSKTTDTVRMPPPREIPRRSQTKPSLPAAIPSTVTKELRSRTISTSSDDLDHPRQKRTRGLSSASSTDSASPSKSPPKKSVKNQPLKHESTASNSLSTTKSKSSPTKKAPKIVDSDEKELVVDEPSQSNSNQIEVTPTEQPETSTQKIVPEPNKVSSNVMARKRRVENPAPITVKPTVKVSQARPPSPRRALLIDIPVNHPQRKLRTTRATNLGTKLTNSAPTKQSLNTFNFIASVFRDVTSKKLPMRDALKRFNTEIEKHGGDGSISVEQFAESLCRFIRGENFGDLWFVLKQSAKNKKSTGQESLLSSAERQFFEFIFELNSKDEESRWPGIFLMLARVLCADCERSPATSFVQKCQDVRVMMCALFFSNQHEQVGEIKKSECIDQVTAFLDHLLANDDASTVVRVLCFIYTTNGSFLFEHLLSLVTAPVKRIKLVRQHLSDSPADANTFFALIQDDVPKDLVESLRKTPDSTAD